MAEEKGFGEDAYGEQPYGSGGVQADLRKAVSLLNEVKALVEKITKTLS